MTDHTSNRWLDTVTALRTESEYFDLHLLYNIDESGFTIGTSQSPRALVNIRDKLSWKVIGGRQEC